MGVSPERFRGAAAVDPQGEWDEDWAAVWVDGGAGQALPADHPLAAKRAQVDQRILANLLRLNHQRADRRPPEVRSTRAKKQPA